MQFQCPLKRKNNSKLDNEKDENAKPGEDVRN